MNVSELRQNLDRLKVNLSAEQARELERRSWLEDMVKAQGITPDQVQVMLSQVEARIGQAVQQGIESALQRLMPEIASVAARVAGIKIPETDLSPLVDAMGKIEIPMPEPVDFAPLLKDIRAMLPKQKKPVSWSFEFERDRSGNITSASAFPDEE